MPTNIVIPEMGESVRTGVIAKWLKKPGDYVKRDEAVGELETDKITAELTAPAAGRVTAMAKEGDTVNGGAVVARIEEGEAPAGVGGDGGGGGGGNGHAAAATPATKNEPKAAPGAVAARAGAPEPAGTGDLRITPLARKLA